MPDGSLKFTDDVQKQYLALIKAGETKSDAATIVGMDRSTILDYGKRHPEFARKVKLADPSYFSPEKRQKYVLLLMQGQTRTGAAAAVGITPYKVLQFEREHPKVAKQFYWARQVAVQVIADSMYSKAVGGDVQAMKNWLINATKNADESKGEIKWISETTKTELTGANDGPLRIEMTPDERQEKINQLLEDFVQETSGAEELPKLDNLLNKQEMPQDFINSSVEDSKKAKKPAGTDQKTTE